MSESSCDNPNIIVLAIVAICYLYYNLLKICDYGGSRYRLVVDTIIDKYCRRILVIGGELEL